MRKMRTKAVAQDMTGLHMHAWTWAYQKKNASIRLAPEGTHEHWRTEGTYGHWRRGGPTYRPGRPSTKNLINTEQ